MTRRSLHPASVNRRIAKETRRFLLFIHSSEQYSLRQIIPEYFQIQRISLTCMRRTRNLPSTGRERESREQSARRESVTATAQSNVQRTEMQPERHIIWRVPSSLRRVEVEGAAYRCVIGSGSGAADEYRCGIGSAGAAAAGGDEYKCFLFA